MKCVECLHDDNKSLLATFVHQVNKLGPDGRGGDKVDIECYNCLRDEILARMMEPDWRNARC